MRQPAHQFCCICERNGLWLLCRKCGGGRTFVINPNSYGPNGLRKSSAFSALFLTQDCPACPTHALARCVPRLVEPNAGVELLSGIVLLGALGQIKTHIGLSWDAAARTYLDGSSVRVPVAPTPAGA
jgi:hypothetical protein